MVTPVDVNKYELLLKKYNYDREKADYLINGFRHGFDIHCTAPLNSKRYSNNLKLRVGTNVDLWNKTMTEVKQKRFIGPYTEDELPLEFFYQSPQGLVPKNGSTKLRNIFHLSYPRTGVSVNSSIDPKLCTVQFRDVDYAVKQAIKEGSGCYFSSSDFSQAYRNLPLAKKCWPYLVLMAVNPVDHKKYYFVEKNLPFGLSIAPKIFQDFSDSIAFLVGAISQSPEPANYIDDFLNTKKGEDFCNKCLEIFLDICEFINFPVSKDKTVHATQIIVFLGVVLNAITQTISIPEEKRTRALGEIDAVMTARKITVLKMQQLTGILNFIGKAVVPGRAFTRRLYSKMPAHLKQHHHISVDREIRKDLLVWKEFLKLDQSVCRPFTDFAVTLTAKQLKFYTDASEKIGCAGFFNGEFFQEIWPEWLKQKKVSINFLEMYALVAGVLLWINKLENKRVKIYCDNMSVVHMLNNNSSKCKHCMILIRMLVMASLRVNCRIFGSWISTKKNVLADSLSRNDYLRFWKFAPKNTKNFKSKLPSCVWPVPQSWWD